MIYLDHNASTPVTPEILNISLPWFTNCFANPSSSTHVAGKLAAGAVESARGKVAALFDCDPSEIIFTSGATEAINIGIRGAFRQYGKVRNHILVSPAEHSAVLETVRHLQTEGAELSYIPVDDYGRVIPGELEKLIRPNTLLAAVMGANNETGNLNPLKETGKILFENKVLFFSDVTQIPGKLGFDFSSIQASMMCLSGHKMNGMKGAGALYVRRKDPRVQLAPVFFGGGQEHGLRPGTLNTPAIVALGEACDFALSADREKLEILRKPLLEVLSAHPGVTLFTLPGESIPNTLSFSVQGFTSAELISGLPELCISTGSACTSGRKEISHVLAAMQVDEDKARGAVRISFGRTNTLEEAEKTALLFKELLK